MPVNRNSLAFTESINMETEKLNLSPKLYDFTNIDTLETQRSEQITSEQAFRRNKRLCAECSRWRWMLPSEADEVETDLA